MTIQQLFHHCKEPIEFYTRRMDLFYPFNYFGLKASNFSITGANLVPYACELYDENFKNIGYINHQSSKKKTCPSKGNIQ